MPHDQGPPLLAGIRDRGMKMEFNQENKVKIDTLNTTEARAFLAFLECERKRHRIELNLCDLAIRNCQEVVLHDTEGEIFRNASRQFYESAKNRHQEDIDDIDNLVMRVKEGFAL